MLAIQGPRSPPDFGEGPPFERYQPKGSLPLLPNLPLCATLKMLCITVGSSYWAFCCITRQSVNVVH
jgi:hypothetical protein